MSCKHCDDLILVFKDQARGSRVPGSEMKVQGWGQDFRFQPSWSGLSIEFEVQ